MGRFEGLRLDRGVVVTAVAGEYLVRRTADEGVFRLHGASAHVVNRVLSGEAITGSVLERATDELIAAGILVAHEEVNDGTITRRQTLAWGASAASAGIVALVLPSAPVAASYEGYGASFAADDTFGALAGYGDGDGKYFTTTKVAVPEGKTQVRITIAGGAGAATTAVANGAVRGAPGKGALLQVVIPITSTHLHLYVGGRGGVSLFPNGRGQTSNTGMTGSLNLGEAYWGGDGTNADAPGGGGGGASVVYLGNNIANSTLVAIAAGGGGGGGGLLTPSVVATPGGDGGNAGRNGQSGYPGSGSAGGGGGGTQVTNGAGGTSPIAPGSAGIFSTKGGNGGAGGNGGGGGGGGFKSGGGGAAAGFGTTGAGGGGGASFLLASASGASGQYYGTNPVAEAGWIQLEFNQ